MKKPAATKRYRVWVVSPHGDPPFQGRYVYLNRRLAVRIWGREAVYEGELLIFDPPKPRMTHERLSEQDVAEIKRVTAGSGYPYIARLVAEHEALVAENDELRKDLRTVYAAYNRALETSTGLPLPPQDVKAVAAIEARYGEPNAKTAQKTVGTMNPRRLREFS